ncbi:MAG: oligosaccharide flippase family protein [Parachlamydiaceae bacterium]|nr:oligosaccharide flippase family protein [Parachlamydiaceae bacterium]
MITDKNPTVLENDSGANLNPEAAVSKEYENERRRVNWDLENAFNNYFVLIAAQVCVAFFSFSSIWLLNKYIGTDGYGTIVAVIAASQIIQILITWTSISVSKFGTEEFVAVGNISRPFWNRLYFLVLNLALVLVGSFIWFKPLSEWLKISTEFFPYIVAHITFVIFWLHVQLALQGSKLLRVQGILVAAEKISIFLCLLILCLSSRITWFSAFSAYIIAPALMILIGMWYIRDLIFPVSKIEFGYIKKILIFSLPLLPSSVVGYFSTSYLDVFFLSQYLSKTDVGIYWVAYQIAGIVMQFPVLAGSILMPMFVSMQLDNKNDKSALYFTKILPTICYVWTFVCALTATIGGLLLPFIFGEKFSEIYILLWIMMAAAAISSPGLWGYGTMSNAKSLTYISTIYAIVIGSLNVLFNYLLIPRFGLIGCAWASVISTFFGTSIVVFLMNRHLSLKRTGAIEATLFVLIGAFAATIFKTNILSLLAAVIGSLLFAIVYRRKISDAFVQFYKMSKSKRLFSKLGF